MCRHSERRRKWKSAARSERHFIRWFRRRREIFIWRSVPIRRARVGVRAFSTNEGIKYAGHPAAWGEEQAKDFTEHHYHQPSDEYHPEMDFTGDAVIARFGFVLGSKAAWLPTLAGWVPGDEFEPARKKSMQ